MEGTLRNCATRWDLTSRWACNTFTTLKPWHARRLGSLDALFRSGTPHRAAAISRDTGIVVRSAVRVYRHRDTRGSFFGAPPPAVTRIDATSVFFTLLGLSVPNFALGPILILIFSIEIGWLPVSGRRGNCASGFACCNSGRGARGYS